MEANMKIGFLGAGAMGGAILSGAVRAGIVKPEDVYVYDISESIRDKYAELGCNIVSNNRELGGAVDILLSCVKPQQAAGALAELGDTLDGKAMISIMAGLTTATIRKMTGGSFRLLRLMPNTPALVGMGAFALDAGTDLTGEEKAFAQKLFESLGIVEWMSEDLIDTACGLSGAGPAYIYLVIELAHMSPNAPMRPKMISNTTEENRERLTLCLPSLISTRSIYLSLLL